MTPLPPIVRPEALPLLTPDGVDLIYSLRWFYRNDLLLPEFLDFTEAE